MQSDDKNITNKTYLRLCEIQELVKREFSQKHIFTKVINNHSKKVDQISEQILLEKLKISSIVDGINSNANLKYSIKTSTDEYFRLLEQQLYIEPLLFYIRKHQELAYRLLILCETEESKKLFTSFFINYFYSNSFGSSSMDHEFLLMLYRTLKHEIQTMSNNKPEIFLKSSINYFFFRHFILREDVTNYFSKVLAPVIKKIDKLEESKELTFDPIKMTNQIQNAKDLKISAGIYGNRIHIKDDKNNETLTTTDTESSNHSPESSDNNAHNANKIKKDEFFSNYMIDLTTKEIEKSMENIKSSQIKDYIRNYLEIKTDKQTIDNKYKNTGFIDNVYKSKKPSELIEVIFQNFSIVVGLIEQIFLGLNEADTIPPPIRYVCKIIAVLVEEKYPGIEKIQRNSYISQFFINCLIIPILNKPELCGLVKSAIMLGTTKVNLALLSKIFFKYSSGNFFNNVDNPNYTVFNRYFIETFEVPQTFYDKLLDIEFPDFINNIIAKKESLDTYIYDYFKENPKEHIRDNSYLVSNDLILSMIEIFEKHKQRFKDYNDTGDEYEAYVGGIDRLCYHKEKMIKDKEKASKAFPNEKFFYAKQQIEYSKQIEYIFEYRNGKSFIKDKDNSIVNKPKQYFYDILLNLQLLNENPMFIKEITNFSSFLTILKTLTNLSYFSLDSSVNNEWFTNTFISVLKHLPSDYSNNDYQKFFDEMISEIKLSIENMNFEDLKYLLNKTRYAEYNLNNFHKMSDKLKKFSYTQIIRKFMNEKAIECSLIIERFDSTKSYIYIKPKDESLNLKFKYLDDFLYDKKKDSNTEINTITELVKYFPSFKLTSPDKRLQYQYEYKVPEALNVYCNIFLYTFYISRDSGKKLLPKKDKKSKQLGTTELIKYVTNQIQHEEQYQEIRNQIYTYIMNKLYVHLFPLEENKKDRFIYINCQRLAWIQFSDLVDYEDITIDNLKGITSDSINKLGEFKCPNAKLKLLNEVRNAIQKSILLYNTDTGLSRLKLRYLIYFIIQIAPKKLYSNYKFILLYATFKNNEMKESFRTDFQTMLEYLCNPTENLFIKKITKEEFQKMCADAESEISLSKSVDISSSVNNSTSKRSE